ncbi:hypothetical protein FRB90_002662, partial [Tulasnella sp. 427]
MSRVVDVDEVLVTGDTAEVSASTIDVLSFESNRTPRKLSFIQRQPVPSTGVAIYGQPLPIQRVNRPPPGWREYVHPEGQLYYTSSVDIKGQRLTIVTDYPLRPPANHDRIAAAVEVLRDMALEHPYFSKANLRSIEACILIEENNPDEPGYYLVNHQVNALTICYLRDTTSSNLGLALPFAVEDTAAIALQVQYWRHFIDYPSHRELSEKVVQLLGPLMAHSCLDRRLCDDSTAPGSIETLEKLQSLWRQVRDLPHTASIRPDRNWIAARLFYYFLRPRISQGYGTDQVRLERSIRVGPPEATMVARLPRSLRVASRVLFWNDPLECMDRLEDCWRGGITEADKWSSMFTELQSDWDQKNAYSTLAFVGALAALAIPLQGTPNGSSGGGSSAIAQSESPQVGGTYASTVSPTQVRPTGIISVTQVAMQAQHVDKIGVTAGSFSQAFAMFTSNVIVSYKMRRMFKGRIMSRNDNT